MIDQAYALRHLWIFRSGHPLRPETAYFKSMQGTLLSMQVMDHLHAGILAGVVDASRERLQPGLLLIRGKATGRFSHSLMRYGLSS